MDAVSEARLQQVCPALADKIHQMENILAGSVTFRVTEGLRSWAEQGQLYDQGRTLPGKIVTNAPPGSSYHNFGLAVDLVPMDQVPPQPDWNINHPVWQQLLSAGRSVGLTEGAGFRTFPDNPHFQLTGTLPDSPDDEVRQTFLDGGTQAVWELAGLGTS